ncbi:Cytoplasmic dynein 1 heavy chain 1 [Globisporangium polare]
MAPGTEKVAASTAAAPAPAGASNNNAGLNCIKCNRDVSQADAFCIFCGTKVSVTLAERAKLAAAAPASAKPAAPAPKAPAPAPPAVPAPKKPSEAAPAPPAPVRTVSRPEPVKVPAPTPAAAAASGGRPPTSNASSGRSTAPSSAASTRSPPTSTPSAAGRAPSPSPPPAPRSAPSSSSGGSPPSQSNRAASPSPAPRPASARTSYPEDSGGRGSLDSLPSEVAGLEQLWVPDNFSSECMDCKSTFGFPKPRRHHCRVCGLLFCSACVKNKMPIPGSFGYGTKAQPCCRNCITALQMKAITSPADVFAQRKGSKRSLSKDSHYDLLGVSKDASPEEITRQYNNVSRSVNGSSVEDQEQLDKINDAYRTLHDPASRLRHDSDMVRESFASDSVNSYVTDVARSDQNECQVCFRPFKLGRRQHHCRRCTRSVCNTCSEGSKPIPELGFPAPVRHCSSCLDSPPKFIKPVMDPVAKPPAGFEYLSKLDIHLSVKTKNSLAEEEVFVVKTYCEPNEAAVQNVKYALADADRAVANEYAITHSRSFAEFEWLFHALGEYTNIKALPFFPEKRVVKAEREKKAQVLQTFVYGCLLHPLLRDADCLKAFLVLPNEKLSEFRRGSSKKLYDNEKYSGIIMSLRLEFEKAQIRAKVDELVARQKAHTERLAGQKERQEKQKRRESFQNVRREQASTRFKALEARKDSQTERMEREKDRYQKQSGTTHILFFDTVRDESVRKTEEETRQKEKVEFTKSKDAFQADTSQWNNDMALWSKHRADWSEDHNPAVSKDIASEWIVRSYGVYHSSSDKAEQVPRDLVELHNQLVKMQEKEPQFLEEEGNAVDDEWMKLAKEREHWTSDRANMKREDEFCHDEDVRYDQEHDFVRLEAEARQKKVKAIEADLLTLKGEIASRGRCIAQRRTRHTALDDEYEAEWRVVQAERQKSTLSRLDEHDARLLRGKKRTDIFADQLARQAKSQRMLLFKRAALTDERKKDCKLFDEHKEDCKNALEEARNARLITPEYVARLEADMKIREEELQAVVESNQRTAQEGGDSEIDERDEFMNEVRRRRAQFQKELDDQKVQLEKENQLCQSLLKRMNEHIEKLDKEIENAAKEDSLIVEYNGLIDSELKLLADEETKREEKKALITELMNNAGNWVLDALHDHSNRKKREADRLVKQAIRAADLQKLVQHFTHRVIEQEERIMRQKQRILNGEHKVEMLKSSENWFQYVTGHSADLGKKDMKLLENGRGERGEDVKDAARLQKDDEGDVKGVVKELGSSRKFAKEKGEKRELWAQVEDVYSLTKAQEKDEDMMMTSQIRSLLQQLGEAFEMLTNRLMEEEESLQHASTQLEGEVESINAFMERMESEENALCATEKTSLAKESQVRRSEGDLIEQRARSLIDQYKQMQSEHAKYPIDLDKIKSRRNEREKPAVPRDAELEAAKRLIKSRNYYDRRACAEFGKKFKIDNYEFKEVRDVFEWLKLMMERDIKRQEKWLEASRKERKLMEDLKVKGSDIDWDKDTLARIPALKEIQKKLARQNSSGSSNHKNGGSQAEGKLGDAIHASEQWIVELIKSKKNISEVDASLLKNVATAMEAATVEEAAVVANLKKMKTDKEYVLNSIRFIDQEEAKAVRSTGKGVLNGRSNGSLLEASDAASTPRAAEQGGKVPSPKQQSSAAAASVPASPGSQAKAQTPAQAPPAVPKRVHRAIPKPASPAPPPPTAAPAPKPSASDGVTF